MRAASIVAASLFGTAVPFPLWLVYPPLTTDHDAELPGRLIGGGGLLRLHFRILGKPATAPATLA